MERGWREVETFFQRQSTIEYGGGVWEVMQFWRQRAKDDLGLIGALDDVGVDGGDGVTLEPLQEQGQSIGDGGKGEEGPDTGIDWSTTLMEDLQEFPQRVNPTSCMYTGVF